MVYVCDPNETTTFQSEANGQAGREDGASKTSAQDSLLGCHPGAPPWDLSHGPTLAGAMPRRSLFARSSPPRPAEHQGIRKAPTAVFQPRIQARLYSMLQGGRDQAAVKTVPFPPPSDTESELTLEEGSGHAAGCSLGFAVCRGSTQFPPPPVHRTPSRSQTPPPLHSPKFHGGAARAMQLSLRCGVHGLSLSRRQRLRQNLSLPSFNPLLVARLPWGGLKRAPLHIPLYWSSPLFFRPHPRHAALALLCITILALEESHVVPTGASGQMRPQATLKGEKDTRLFHPAPPAAPFPKPFPVTFSTSTSIFFLEPPELRTLFQDTSACWLNCQPHRLAHVPFLL